MSRKAGIAEPEKTTPGDKETGQQAQPWRATRDLLPIRWAKSIILSWGTGPLLVNKHTTYQTTGK